MPGSLPKSLTARSVELAAHFQPQGALGIQDIGRAGPCAAGPPRAASSRPSGSCGWTEEFLSVQDPRLELPSCPRLATLVPPPRAHLVRYHGVFAPASSWRSQVIPLLPDSTPSATPARASRCMGSEDPAPAATEVPPPQALAEVRRPADPSRIPWAELLMRVFREDVLACPCGGRRVVPAYLTQPGPVKAILDHLGLPSTGPPIALARFTAGPAEATWQDDVPVLQQSLR